MDIWRGLFRLWVLASGLWLLFVGALHWDEVRSPFVETHYFAISNRMVLSGMPWMRWGAEEPQGYTRIDFPNRIVVFAENGIPEASLNEWARSFAREHVSSRDKEISDGRRRAIWAATVIAVIPAVFVLLLGLALRWVANGFRR